MAASVIDLVAFLYATPMVSSSVRTLQNEKPTKTYTVLHLADSKHIIPAFGTLPPATDIWRSFSHFLPQYIFPRALLALSFPIVLRSLMETICQLLSGDFRREFAPVNSQLPI